MPYVYVNSDPSGVEVTAEISMPPSVVVKPTPFSVTPLSGINCVLTAPLDAGGVPFDHWEVFPDPSSPIPDYRNRTITINTWVDVTATAFYKPFIPPYSNVTITTTGNGTTEPPAGNYPSTYEIGSTLYVTATPAGLWHLVIMRRNGENWTSNNPGQFINLQATENIEVVFAPDTTPPPPPNIIPILIIGALGLAGLGYYLWKRKK